MNIGKLRHKITIQEQQGTDNDGAGNEVPNWVNVAFPWASVNPYRGTETTIAEKRTEEVSHIVTIRYRKGMKKDKHRVILKDGRVLKIEYIINKDERNIQLELFCKDPSLYGDVM